MLSECVVRTGLDETVEHIAGFYDSGNWNEVKLSAALFDFVSKKIDRDSYDSHVSDGYVDVKDFDQLIEQGGNCLDKSVFLASLLEHVQKVEVILICIDGDPGHVLLEVGFQDYSRGEIVEQITEFCIMNKCESILGFSDPLTRSSENLSWFIIDPSADTILSGKDHLVENGYMIDTKKGYQWDRNVSKEIV